MNLARTHKSRRGMTVVAVLICLIVITLIGGALVKVASAQRKLVRAQEHRLQAEWLAESGAQRALARLDADPGYKGETWSISADELGQSAPAPPAEERGASGKAVAQVTIAVERLSGNDNRRRIRVMADYPRDPSLRSRSTKHLLHDVEPPKAGDSK
jgi:Tfp pilus assembly protein PilX